MATVSAAQPILGFANHNIQKDGHSSASKRASNPQFTQNARPNAFHNLTTGYDFSKISPSKCGRQGFINNQQYVTCLGAHEYEMPISASDKDKY